MKKVKSILTLLLAFVLVLGLVGCSTNEKKDVETTTTVEKTEVTEQTETTEAVNEEKDEAEANQEMVVVNGVSYNVTLLEMIKGADGTESPQIKASVDIKEEAFVKEMDAIMESMENIPPVEVPALPTYYLYRYEGETVTNIMIYLLPDNTLVVAKDSAMYKPVDSAKALELLKTVEQ